jgi:hypothetical protein
MIRIAMAALLALCLPLGACSGEGSGEGDRANTARDDNHRSDSGPPDRDAMPAPPDGGGPGQPGDPVMDAARRLIDEGRATFRFETFGDEAFWGGALRLHDAIKGEALGGVGDGISPATALALGLKVDLDALPPELVAALVAGEVDLDDPATTLALLQLDAVVGVKGVFDEAGALVGAGIRCALCHSTVDDSLVPGIGHRLDGWAARDLDVGAIIAAAPDLSVLEGLLGVDQATIREVLRGWGPGKFDATMLLDGQVSGPLGSSATLIPPAYGLAGVNLHTFTGWGSVPYWNALVANLEMQGQGVFFDPRLDDASRFPIAAANQFGHRTTSPDLVTPRLAALHFYQLALEAPAPPEGSFDAGAAERGRALFEGEARCAGCHVPPLYTEPGWNLHTPEEIGIDDFQSSRSPDGRYRTTPLKGLWSHQKGGFYHDGRFETLYDVVCHYDSHFDLGLSEKQKQDLVQYLLSL